MLRSVGRPTQSESGSEEGIVTKKIEKEV